MNDQLLEKLVQLQEEQNQLLKKHLTRIRFSLWSLLVLTTLMGISLGLGVYFTRPKTAAAVPATAAFVSYPPPPIPSSNSVAPNSPFPPTEINDAPASRPVPRY